MLGKFQNVMLHVIWLHHVLETTLKIISLDKRCVWRLFHALCPFPRRRFWENSMLFASSSCWIPHHCSIWGAIHFKLFTHKSKRCWWFSYESFFFSTVALLYYIIFSFFWVVWMYGNGRNLVNWHIMEDIKLKYNCNNPLFIECKIFIWTLTASLQKMRSNQTLAYPG